MFRMLGIVVGAALASSSAFAGSYATIHEFSGGQDGSTPWSGLTVSGTGDLYGTTQMGGAVCSTDIGAGSGCGTVFALSAAGVLTTLHQFDGSLGKSGGMYPISGVSIIAGHIVGSAGGGSYGYGMIFSMQLDGTAFAPMHQFSGADGANPVGLLRNTPFGIFGITTNGGDGYEGTAGPKLGNGVLYVTAPDGRFAVSHRFAGGMDGHAPTGLVVDATGNLFGSTQSGGGACQTGGGCGTVFEYVTATKSYSILYRFTRQSDGYAPTIGAVGPDGTLYGVASGGDDKHGLLFSLTPHGASYDFAVLADFRGHVAFGQPTDAPSLSRGGEVVGAIAGALYVYRAGQLSEAVEGRSLPSIDPLGPLLPGPDGTVYGTSASGGITPCPSSSGATNPSGCGVIFSYKAF